jgi:hypothetical protein
MGRKPALWAVGALLCVAVFAVMITMPTPDIGTGRGESHCPSLVTMLRLGTDPSRPVKEQAGIALDNTYFICSRHSAVPWAVISVLAPCLLALAGWMVLRPRGSERTVRA